MGIDASIDLDPVDLLNMLHDQDAFPGAGATFCLAFPKAAP